MLYNKKNDKNGGRAMIFTLRDWRRSDVESLAENADNPKIAQKLRDVFPSPYTKKDAEFFINVCKESISEDQITKAIDVSGEAVGCIGLTFGKDVYRKSAELGFWLGEDYWGNGIMTAAVKELSGWAFQNRDIVRICAEVFEGNFASEKVLLKAGFFKEAIHRKAVVKDGVLLDSQMFALLKEEYDKLEKDK